MAKKNEQEYKNVYTILEKVKKGEIKSHYKDQDGLFGKINFYKKADLVKPHLHYIDDERISNIMEAYIKDQSIVKTFFDRMSKTAEFGKIPTGQKPDLAAFTAKFQENFKKIPKHLANDIFKMYYYRMEQLSFAERDEKNHVKFKFLEKANNPVGKIMSETSNLKSVIFTRSTIGYFLSRITQLEYLDEEKSNQLMNGMNGDGGSEDEMDDIMKEMMDSKPGQKQLDDVMQDAQNLCKQMDNNLDDDTQESMYEATSNGREAGKISPSYIKDITYRLESINMSMGAMKEKIKKLMDKSKSYFSSKKVTTYEDLFNTDNMAGMEDYELLHPKLRKMFLEDITVKNTKSIGKIDIYIDISTSMDATCGVRNSKGQTIDKLEFCKAFAAKMKALDVLNNVYLFNTRVRDSKNDLISIATINTSGGTTINEAVRSINKEGRNAIVITDAEDSCSIYSDKAFFIGVNGARFSSFAGSTIREYSNRGQVVVFDGTTIKSVNDKGHV